ncbi:MAG: oxygen-independent coproporphyrinogen III oxidase, partial [Alphaproteobacteria bacterium]|nr:oxygen-independent coproporphyrinogen III oxidase [Alphaproteobacteria bacterium]
MDKPSMVDPVEKYGSARVPRYTSYPTAPHFHDGVDGSMLGGWLGALDPAVPLSVYVHVPFCDRLCWYCGCHTTISSDPVRIGAYADVLTREIETVAAALPATMSLSHVHFGGGTPTQLGEDSFAALMAALRRHFTLAAGAEIAIEIDPTTLTPAMAETLGREGVTRASLGVQDFTDEVQQAINRVQPVAMVADATAMLRQAGIAALNFDLMYGLPHQTEADIARTVDQAVALAPDRVAMFGYAHVPWMRKHQQMIDEAALAGPEGRAAQADTAARQLESHGYRRIGMDHFARADDAMAKRLDEGALHRNFQGYTDDAATALIGLGASAISALPQGYGQNAGDMRAYREAVMAGGLATVRGIALDNHDRACRAIIERLMCDFAADVPALCRQHGAD